MKHILLALVLTASAVIAQTPSTGDYLFSKRAASGPNLSQWLAPNSNDLLGWNSGALTNVSRSTFALASHNQAWSTITSTPTTLTGYGITDAQGLDSDLTAIAALAPSQGAVLYRGASGWTSLGTGTNGQVLTTSGTGADPTWTTITAGASLSGTNQWTGQQSFNLASTTGAININPTWNNGATSFRGLYMDVTSTAAASTSKLLAIGRGGAERFSIQSTGNECMTITSDGSGSSYAEVLARFVRGSLTQFFVMGDGNPRGVSIAGAGCYGFASTTLTPTIDHIDASLTRPASGIIRVCANAAGTTGGVIELIERAAPSAPTANMVRLYSEDNGSGKTRLMALFPSGAAQQIAIEP